MQDAGLRIGRLCLICNRFRAYLESVLMPLNGQFSWL